MLDRSPQKHHIRQTSRRQEKRAELIAEFQFDEQNFEIILAKGDCDLTDAPKHPREIARFIVRGQTLAIIGQARRPAPERALALVAEARPRPELDGETRKMIARLTERELQIAAMIAQGAATKNVAYKLRISEWTVGTHLRRIFAKLGVDNRAAMVYRCASLIDQAPSPEPIAERSSTSVC